MNNPEMDRSVRLETRLECFRRRYEPATDAHQFDGVSLEFNHLACRERAAGCARRRLQSDELPSFHAFLEVGFDLPHRQLTYGPHERVADNGALVDDRFPLEVSLLRERD